MVEGGSGGRRGWQLPERDEPFVQDEPADVAEPPPDVSGQPRPTLSGGVFGQVVDVDVGSVQMGQMSQPVLTMRLERNDPHAGRTFVAAVRLTGGDALGFADVGDWVEAVGRKKSAYLVASRCVNHTTGAVYTGGTPKQLRVIVIFLAVVALMIGGFVFFATQMAEKFDDQSKDFRQQSIERCLEAGGSREFCGAAP